MTACPEHGDAFWISWYHTEDLGPFELHSPWWVSGYRGDDDAATICAAVHADSEHAAKNIIDRAYDSPPGQLEFRFCEARGPRWVPFSERFPKAEWMVWP
jgi:hypothetical protein